MEIGKIYHVNIWHENIERFRLYVTFDHLTRLFVLASPYTHTRSLSRLHVFPSALVFLDMYTRNYNFRFLSFVVLSSFYVKLFYIQLDIFREASLINNGSGWEIGHQSSLRSYVRYINLCANKFKVWINLFPQYGLIRKTWKSVSYYNRRLLM